MHLVNFTKWHMLLDAQNCKLVHFGISDQTILTEKKKQCIAKMLITPKRCSG